MSRRRIWNAATIAAASALILSVAPALAQSRTPASAESSYTFAFQDAPIAQITQEVLSDLGVKFSIDPSVTGRMSFRIDQRLTKAQLLEAFEAVLAANGVALVRDGDALVVTAKGKAKSVASVRPLGEGQRSVGYDVVAVPLSYASASEVAKALDAITGSGTVIYANDKLGILVLGGAGQELQSALETVHLFDQSGLQSSKIRWFELSQAPADAVAAELDTMLKAGGMTGVSVAPLRRLNGLIVFGRTSQALDEVSAWVARLDQPTKDTSASIWAYHPKNTSAEGLSRTLNSLGGSQSFVDPPSARGQRPAGLAGTAAAPAEPAVVAATTASADDFLRAAVDKDTNTLLVSAPVWKWVKIQKILAELDRPQAQILIQATIVEVTLGNTFRMGVDWSVFTASKRLQITNDQTSTGTIGPSFPGFSINYLTGDVQAALNALGAKTNIEVISAPKVVTLDNHAARLEVGDQIPIIVQSAQATTTAAPLVNTVDYRNSGVILNVTPRVSGENRIVLDVGQEVSAAIKTDTSGIDSPTIQQRKLESTLVLNDGGVVALGGLISRTRSRGDSGIPWLKDVPGLGALFKSATNEDKRTELIVLLTAKILPERPGAGQASGDLLADMREIRNRGLLNGPP